MALTATTLAAAITDDQNFITVASATGFSAGNYVRIDGEDMQVQNSYVSGVTIPVMRGVNGTQASAHVITASVKTYLATDDTGPAAQGVSSMQYSGRPVILQSITATSSLTLPPVGCDLRLTLNGTSVITLTVPVPTKDMDGAELTIVGNGIAAHVLTFTGGLSGGGSSYDIITVNAQRPIAVKFIACNGLWIAYAQIPIAGTVTDVTGTLT